eukprot:4290902-Pleurochrysis_carterae.AAC.3
MRTHGDAQLSGRELDDALRNVISGQVVSDATSLVVDLNGAQSALQQVRRQVLRAFRIAAQVEHE